MPDLLNKPPKQVLLFSVQDIYACIDLLCVNKILSLPQLNIMPGCSNYLAGLMNLSGKSIPVIDLALRLGAHRKTPYSTDTPILLCSHGAQQIGIIVDEIIGLNSFTDNLLQENTQFSTNDSPFLGTLNLNSQLYLLMDIQKIINTQFADNESTIHRVQKTHD